MVLNGFDWGYFIIMSEDKEIWKDVLGYEGSYQISDFGNVKSLSREMNNGKRIFISKEKILRPQQDAHGYLHVRLCKNGVTETKKIHKLVAISFLNHTPNGHNLEIDHVDGNRLNNRIENLQIVTHRANKSTCFVKGKENYSSKYIGVSWYKRDSRWHSQITINGETKFLGYFDSETEAHEAYQKALLKLNQ